jgi:hypothetical protein
VRIPLVRVGQYLTESHWPEQARKRDSSSGKWRYTVARVTPARPAMAEMVVFAGPTSA